MWGKSYQVGRHMGRIGMDSRQRMTNRAEVGFGMVGTASIIALIVILVVLFI